MFQTFLITIQQMAILFFFMAFGFFFAKLKKVGEDASNVLSKLCVNIFVPALSFSTMAECCTVKNLTEDKWMFLTGLCVLAVTLVIGIFVSKLFSKNRDTQSVYTYALTCPNYGYIGYPIVTALLGQAALFDFMIWTMPFFIFTYMVAVQMLKPGGRISLKGLVTSPSTIAMVLGMICGLAGITDKLPEFITGFASVAGACMTPVGMVMTGMVLGKQEIKKLFDNVPAYIISSLRLIILPLVGLLVFWLAGIRGANAIMGVLFLSLPGGLNTIVFPEAYGGDSMSGARVVFITNVVGLLTIPLMVSLAAAVLS